ncbi:aminotransferase, class IV [Streptococcus parasanguinis SK236]|nr:aminotransferase class IV [Streptococcus parasanguinis]EGU63227.1 aminotransferase, class IV [Streptococcus parasanguinis SK236]
MREQTVIPILRRNSAIYGVGGGITWDSKWESEYQETKQKSAVLYRQEPHFELLTTGCIHQGELTFLEQHLTRLREASRYFAYPYDEPKLLKELQEELSHLDLNLDYRCRIALQKNGTFHLVITELTDLPASYLQAQLTEQKLDLATPFTYFKTSQRDHLNQSDHEQIFHLPDETLLETTIGNLVLEIEGQLYTPPAHLPLLDGIYRRHLLETQQVEEKQDANKQQMIQILTELKGLNLTDTAKACPLPSLVVCGSRDWANQSSSKKLAKLLPKGRYQEIADGGHLLNTEKPYELAQAIKEFVAGF